MFFHVFPFLSVKTEKRRKSPIVKMPIFLCENSICVLRWTRRREREEGGEQVRDWPI